MAIEIYHPTRIEIPTYLPDIQSMVEKELKRERPLYDWSQLVSDLANGLINLSVVYRDGQAVACCGWNLIQWPKGSVAKVAWFAAHEWDSIKENLADEMEKLFIALGADYAEFWTRPGVGRFLRERGMKKYEEGYTKRIRA